MTRRSGFMLMVQPDMASHNKNVDFTVNKRMSHNWSLLTSFFYNWDLERGHPQTPNDERFNERNLTNWAFKVVGVYRAPWGISINPVLRTQSGLQLNRIVQVTLRTGTLNYQAESPTAYRAPNVSIFDISGDKKFAIGKGRSMSIFLAAFNLTNANTATSQDNIVGVRTATFGSENVQYQRFLRPVDILPPRVLRFGVNLAF
jgi:hypothetical protein